MTQTTLTADIIAKAALAILDNELGWVKTLYRAHESEFSQKVNGYTVGDEISIRRPADFVIRRGPTMDIQNVIEGKTTLKVDQQIGVDFNFTSTDLTLQIKELAERVMKPAMTTIINDMARDLATEMYSGFYSWVGTPGNRLDSYVEFALACERLDEMAVPEADRCAILSPTDAWGLTGNQTGLFVQDIARDAYRRGALGEIGGVDTYKTQITPTHTVGAHGGTPLVRGAAQNVSYDSVKNTFTQTLVTDGWTGGVGLKKGDVFTIAGVHMVNARTKATTGILQQFVITADVTADASASNATNLVISPPIITSGPHQTVTAAPADNAAITYVGTASTPYRQNMVYHKNAMALAVVPMEMPQAAYGGSRQSYKDFSVRVIPTYNGTNDVSRWRMDLLYGRKLIDPRLGTRLS